MTTCPGGTAIGPGGICIPCTTGHLEVTVYRLAVCWDTGPGWENSPDPPLPGVEVSISGPESRTGRTNNSGVALFQELTPGDYTITVSKSEPDPPDPARPTVTYEDVSTSVDPPGSGPATVVIGHTTHARRTMRREGLECNRKHVAPPGPQGDGGPTIWLPIFWIFWSEPFWILFLVRDTVMWGGSVTGIVLGAVYGNVSLVAFAAAFLGYMSNVIFGMALGITLMVIAFIGYLVIAVLAMFPSIVPGFSPADPWFFPMVSGTWVGFAYALIRGRLEEFSVEHWGVPIVSGILGLLMSVLVLVLMGVSGWAVIIFAALFSLIAAFAAGLLGHAFMNDGKTKAQIWGESDFLLPYDGDRYCVQGLRGWISHFGMQEFSYDWALPEGRPYMSAKEGHIIGFREDRHGTKACGKNPIANEIRVRHRDGSIARYLHGTRRGVSRVNPELRPVREQLPNNPVHVRAGQLLAETGNVGHSMFSHLHFTVLAPSGRATNPGDASDYLPVKFVGPSAGRHGGVCYSMRKYRSTSVNLGPVRVIAPAPGAPAPAVPASPWNDVRYGSESWDTAALGFSPPPAQTTPASPPPEIPPSQNLPDTFSPTPPRGVLV